MSSDYTDEKDAGGLKRKVPNNTTDIRPRCRKIQTYLKHGKIVNINGFFLYISDVYPETDLLGGYPTFNIWKILDSRLDKTTCTNS